MPAIPICADCCHSYTLPGSAKYRRCDRKPSDGDAALCGNMRAAGGDCGPDATLFEARGSNGQA